MYIGDFQLDKSDSRRKVFCHDCNVSIRYGDLRLRICRGQHFMGSDVNEYYCEKCMAKQLETEVNSAKKLITLLKGLLHMVKKS